MKQLYLLKLIFISLVFLTAIESSGQGVVISDNPSALPDASSMLDVQSSTKGLLPPRMSTSQRNLIPSPANGLMVFDTDLQSLMLRISSSWQQLGSGSGPWTQNGSIISYTGGNVGVGTSNPLARLESRSNTSNGTALSGIMENTGGYGVGVYAQSQSLNGTGLLASASGNGYTFGIRAETFSSDGTAIYALATATEGYLTTGVLAESDGFYGTGIAGVATSFQGTTRGVVGDVNSPDGHAGYFTGPSGSKNYFQRSVGIGTSNPLRELHVRGDPAGILVEGSSGNSAYLRFMRGGVDPDDNNNYIALSGSNGSLVTRVGGVDRMRILSDGNVGIGTNSPTFQLHLSQNSAGKPTSNTWTISSDKRLKKNIATIEGALGKTLQLRGVEYEWINPENQGNMTGRYMGMIAQEVEEVFPGWIDEGPDGYKRLTVTGFEGLMIEALRELKAEKDAEIKELREMIRMQQEIIERLNTSDQTERWKNE